jgi:hypothetical protein
MEFVCKRCEQLTKQRPYRVTTEDGGLVLLNMLVCASCARLAKRLGLPAVKMKSAKKVTETKSINAISKGRKRDADLFHAALQSRRGH